MVKLETLARLSDRPSRGPGLRKSFAFLCGAIVFAAAAHREAGEPDFNGSSRAEPDDMTTRAELSWLELAHEPNNEPSHGVKHNK